MEGDIGWFRRNHLVPVPRVSSVEQARAAGRFTTAHDAWWAAARKAYGDRDGTPRALIEVLSDR